MADTKKDDPKKDTEPIPGRFIVRGQAVNPDGTPHEVKAKAEELKVNPTPPPDEADGT